MCINSSETTRNISCSKKTNQKLNHFQLCNSNDTKPSRKPNRYTQNQIAKRKTKAKHKIKICVKTNQRLNQISKQTFIAKHNNKRKTQKHCEDKTNYEK